MAQSNVIQAPLFRPQQRLMLLAAFFGGLVGTHLRPLFSLPRS